MARTMAGAAIKTITIDCTIDTISIGMLAMDCMRVPPARKKPNSNAASVTPNGWLLPNNARAILSKPYPA